MKNIFSVKFIVLFAFVLLILPVSAISNPICGTPGTKGMPKCNNIIGIAGGDCIIVGSEVIRQCSSINENKGKCCIEPQAQKQTIKKGGKTQITVPSSTPSDTKKDNSINIKSNQKSGPTFAQPNNSDTCIRTCTGRPYEKKYGMKCVFSVVTFDDIPCIIIDDYDIWKDPPDIIAENPATNEKQKCTRIPDGPRRYRLNCDPIS